VYAFGFLAYPLGKYRESADHLRVAVRVGRALDASRTVALALTDLAWALIEDARQVEDARRYTEEARELTEALDDVWLKGFVAHGRAMSFRHESPEATLPLVEHSCALLEAAGDAINAMRARANVAYCALELGQLDYATSINEEALREARTFGDRYMISCILNNQALIHLLLGRSCEAAGLLYESLDILRRLPAGRVLAETFLIASGIEASGGDAGRAAFLLGGGDAELARLETEMTRVEHQIHDDLVEPLRPGRLEEFDAAYRRGLQAPIEELHDYAAETASMRSGLSSGS
jgi:tetratricopeptide (TPR) repeat protein